jgi:hypothetical protein
MKTTHRILSGPALVALAALVAVLGACAKTAPKSATPSSPAASSPASSPAATTPAATSTAAAPGASSTEKPAPVDSAVPGDIPDTTQFVAHRSDAGHFTIKAPEGWAEQSGSSSVTYTGTTNMINVTWMPAAAAPTVLSATSQEVPQLQQSERAFQLGKVTAVTLPAGGAVEVTYKANSAPNPVTGKQYLLDVLRYELWKSGTEAVITLSSPAGADNVDPWATVAKSFAWL